MSNPINVRRMILITLAMVVLGLFIGAWLRAVFNTLF